MAKWTKLTPIQPEHNPCLHCPDPHIELSMDNVLAVGFGDAHLERDGEYILSEQDRDDWITINEDL